MLARVHASQLLQKRREELGPQIKIQSLGNEWGKRTLQENSENNEDKKGGGQSESLDIFAFSKIQT